MSDDGVDAPEGDAVDPYRWLEDDTGDVEQWVSRQNELDLRYRPD